VLSVAGRSEFISARGLSTNHHFEKDERRLAGIGPALLKDALLRAASAADTIGVRALFVHAKDIEAKSFYEHFAFEPSPTDPLHLFLISPRSLFLADQWPLR
jgi:GNAT superfamily N-acetyltransferase